MKTYKEFNEARMSAAVKLQRAFEREKAKSEASRRRGEEVMAQARAEAEKKMKTPMKEGTTQINGTDKIEIGAAEIATKKKTEKEMQDQQNESWTFDTAALAKQELADAKNKKKRKRGKVANLLRKLGMKEEAEQIDELSRDTLLSYANKVSLDSQKHSKDPTKRSGAKASRSVTGYARANNRLEKPIKEDAEHLKEYEISHDGKGNYRDDEGNEWNSKTGSAHRSRFGRSRTITSKEPDHPHAVHINGKKWKTFGSHSHASNVAKKIKGATVHKEEFELTEANHREFAQQGKMHPDMAKHMKTGQECDFYHCKTGDKISGVVKHKSDTEVHIKAHKDGKMGAGETHKFSVSNKLDESKEQPMLNKPKSLREFIETIAEAKPVNIDKVQAAGDKPHEEKWEDAKKPAVKKESFTAEELLVALKEGLWPGTPEHTAKFGDKYAQKQGGGAGVKKGTRYGGSLQKPEKEDDNDADDKPAKKNK